MAGETTGVVFISHRDIHPDLRGVSGSRLWRLGYVATLIEKRNPVWVLSAAGHAAGESPKALPVAHIETGRPAIESLVVAALGLFGLPQAVGFKAASDDVLHERDGIRFIAPRSQSTNLDESEEEVEVQWSIPSRDLVRACIDESSIVMRLGVAALPSSLLATQGAVSWLRGEGFDVDEFAYKTG